MRISKEQLAIIDSLRCERLSSDEKNLREISSFYNSRNDNLVEPLRNEAYQEDENGEVAYYLIKNENGEILFYFSLKCGLLYDHYIDDEKLQLVRDMLKYLLELKKDPTVSQEDKQSIDLIFEKLRSRKGITKADVDKIKKNDGNRAIDSIEREFDRGFQKVGETFAGIELVQFCANDNCRGLWNDFQLGRKMGVVVFWHFVVPIVLKVMEFVGCRYLFLFAADLSEDEDLVNYYRTDLLFEDAEDRGTAIPIYDDTCKFMYQETANLKQKQEYFYANFNRDENAV